MVFIKRTAREKKMMSSKRMADEKRGLEEYADEVLKDQEKRKEKQRGHKQNPALWRKKRVSDLMVIKICTKCGQEKILRATAAHKRYIEKHPEDFAQPGTKEWDKYHKDD